MAEMKDSGIEWVGKIPENWKVLKNKYNFELSKEIIGTKWVETQLLSLTKYGVKAINDGEQTGKVPESLSTYQKVNKDDIVMCLFDLDCSAVFSGISNFDGMISPAYKCIRCKPHLCPQYVDYYFRTVFVDRKYKRYSKNVRFSISSDEFMNLPIIVPPIDIQKKIAEFLNFKCFEIDTLHSDIEKQIKTLEEYKKSIITEAVTRGLDPDVEMKDSGIEWIGKIPKNWKTNKIKYLFTSGKGLSITKENLIDEGLPVISYGQIHSKTNSGVDINKDLLQFVSYEYQKRNPNCEVKKFDFIFADTSEDYEGCGNGVYKRDNSILFAGYHSIILRAINQKDNRYLAYLFLTDLWRKQIRETASGVKVFSVTQKNLINSSIILPPEDEQNEIANYLDVKCNKIDNIIVDKKKQLETLEQYKKSLIYEYVTGKKEVLND